MKVFVLQSVLNLFFGIVFQVIEEEKIQENSHVTGTYMLEELAKIQDEVEIVGDVRGKGLMIGVEMVTDKVGFCLDLFILNIVILHPFFDYFCYKWEQFFISMKDKPEKDIGFQECSFFYK